MDENLITELAEKGIVSDTFRRLSSDKKLRVYETAVRLFGEYGYDGLSVDRLCREGGISKGSFFQYFPSKSHLLEFAILVFDANLARWVAEIRARQPATLAHKRLLHLYRKLVADLKLHKAEGKFYHLLTAGIHHSVVVIEEIDLERHIRGYIEEIIVRSERTGEIRGDYDSHLTSYLVYLFIAGLLDGHGTGEGIPLHLVEGYLMSFLFDGIKA